MNNNNFFCDICLKTFAKNQNLKNHLKSNYHLKRCIKIEEAKEKIECKGCNQRFIKRSTNYYAHIKRNAFLECKQYDFELMGIRYVFECNSFMAYQGNKDGKTLSPYEAEIILDKYKALKQIEGVKNIHKQKWLQQSLITDDGELFDHTLTDCELSVIESIDDNSDYDYYETRINHDDRFRGDLFLTTGQKYNVNNEYYKLYYCAVNNHLRAYGWFSPYNNEIITVVD
tara:strand:+ start:263 stop:946 length:684 start_codon:yes stop_codon:yes gene_type:complete